MTNNNPFAIINTERKKETRDGKKMRRVFDYYMDGIYVGTVRTKKQSEIALSAGYTVIARWE